MKNLSKVLAVVLAFAMALSMVSFAAYTDVAEGDNCEEAVTVLSALNILTGYEDGSFKPEATITRAEFAAVVVRMLGYADIAANGSTIFTDVAADHWANGVIALAAQQGIVNGYGDGRFGPEDPVKYEEAIKMIVAALGYTPMADANGGYPGGYQVVAAGRGILTGANGAPGVPATRATVAQMAFNALTVPLMEQTAYGTETVFKPVQKLLLNNLGVTKLEGVVNATSASNDTLKAGEVKVSYTNQITAPNDNTNYAIKVNYVAGNSHVALPQISNTIWTNGTKVAAKGDVEAAAKALVDVAAVMYVKDVNYRTAELVCIMKDDSKNATLSFNATEVKTAAPNFTAVAADPTNGVVAHAAYTDLEIYTDYDAGEYDEYDLAIEKVYINGRERTYANTAITGAAGIEAQLELYFNNAAVSPAAKNVDITLLANDATREDVYTVAYITIWADAKVNTVAEKTWTIYTDAGSIVLNETDEDLKFTIYKDGEIASFADIAEDDVVSYAGYRNTTTRELEYGELHITSDKVSGKITGKVPGESSVYIDGEEYDTKDAAFATSLKQGNSYVFYVNNRGVIIAEDKTETVSNLKYGFASWIYEGGVMDNTKIRLLSADGKWGTYELADRITSLKADASDTDKFDTADIVWTNASTTIRLPGNAALYENSAEAGQFIVNGLVAYELNDDGKVKTLLLETYGNGSAAAAENSVFTSWMFSATNAMSDKYVAATGLIGGLGVDESTAIISVDNSIDTTPDADADLISASNEKLVTVVSTSALTDNAGYTITAGANQDADTGVWPVLLGTDVRPGIDWAANFFVVTEAPMSTTNEAGDEGTLITGIQNGETVKLFVNDESGVAIKEATYTNGSTAITTANFAGTTNYQGGTAGNAIQKGDVLIYTLDANGEAATVTVLLEATAVKASAKATGNTAYGWATFGEHSADANGHLGKISVGSTEYKFILGYVKDMTGENVTIVGPNFTSGKQFRFDSDMIGARYDAFTGRGTVVSAIYADAGRDIAWGTSDADNLGDLVFARVTNNVVVDDFVLIANSAN